MSAWKLGFWKGLNGLQSGHRGKRLADIAFFNRLDKIAGLGRIHKF
jgi:hypothetical protein